MSQRFFNDHLKNDESQTHAFVVCSLDMIAVDNVLGFVRKNLYQVYSFSLSGSVYHVLKAFIQNYSCKC